MIFIVLLLIVGVGFAADNTTEAPGTLRKTLHGLPVGVAPTAVEDAVTVAVSVRVCMKMCECVSDCIFVLSIV